MQDGRDRQQPDDAAAERPRGPIALFFAANVLFGAGLYYHAFLYNFYLQGIGHAESVMGVAAAAISAGGLVALMPAGLIVDRFGVRTSYVAAAGLGALGLAAGAIAQNMAAIYVAAAAAGAAAGAWRVTMAPALIDLATPDFRTRAFSWNTAFLVGSGAIWTAAAGATASLFETLTTGNQVAGLRAALLVGAVATGCAGLVAPLALRRTGRWAGETARPNPESADPAESPGRGWLGTGAVAPDVAWLIVAIGVFWTAGALALPFYNIFFEREFGLSISRIGLVLAGGQAVTAVAVFASGEGAARIGPRRMLTGWLLVFPAVLWGMALMRAAGPAIALYIAQAFVLPAVYPLVDQIVLERVAADRRGAVSGWRNVATEGSGLAGAAIGGYLLRTAEFTGLFALAGAIALAGAAVAIRLLRHHPTD